MIKPEDVVVIYHDKCTDGFCSAHLFYLCYGPDAVYHPANHDDSVPPLQFFRGRTVYIVDFSYPENDLINIALWAKNVIVLDHHKTASHVQELIEDGVIEGIFDLNRSGARLAFDYLMRLGYTFDQHTHEIVNYVQDADLYRWSIGGSREVNAAIRCYPKTFEAWNAIPEIKTLWRDGYAINMYRKMLIDEHLEAVYKDELIKVWANGEYVSPLVPHVRTTCIEIVSDLGHEMSKGHPFAVIRIGNKCSLRSQPEGADVSEIAKIFGGGGHRNAAGFTIKDTL